ncbi:unnamed protein product [Miscanthus lutarioriparius]|uniref:Uncharacterized protein n=1 Tax=Miscanthus lutarioriparius TaxID=422564 RepID=A0A811P3G2_9POAL|nr:unnamed protein product [Miscanthus lutarioriparius]
MAGYRGNNVRNEIESRELQFTERRKRHCIGRSKMQPTESTGLPNLEHTKLEAELQVGKRANAFIICWNVSFVVSDAQRNFI